MPSRLFSLFRRNSGKAKDGLTQPQREAIADLLHFCLYADNTIVLAEEQVIDDVVASFDWDPRIAFESFEARSVANARRAKENPETANSLLASARRRLDTEASRKRALEACQKLLAAGSSTDKESTTLVAIENALGS